VRAAVSLLAVTALTPLLGFTGSGPFPVPLAVPDTILRTDLSRAPATVSSGLTASPSEPHVRLGLRLIPISSRGVGLREAAWSPPSLVPSDPLQPTPFEDVVLRWRVASFGAALPDSSLFLPAPPPPPARVAAVAGQEKPRLQTEYADLALSVTNRMELGGNWTRFRPCDQQFKVSCNPTLIPQLTPEMRFGVQVDGTIVDRIKIDVDFDQSREFDAANRINISYEGGEDDILRRLEVGDVNFRLPRSRFLTEGIPAGNFGFQAEGQLGPLDFQTVWAQQRGDLNSRVFQLTGLGDQRAFVQEDTLVLDDADYVRGQFFFLVDPRTVQDYPHVDVLSLDAGSAPATSVPGVEPIQLYRFEDDPVFQQQVEGFIQADAVAEADGRSVTESGWFRYLQPGIDYFVHPSGLWIALRAPLRREEMLAVTYVTAAGDTVGDYNPERLYNAGGRPQLRLLKASGANHQPGRPTWDQEMHQIYRVSGSPDVEQASVELTVSLGEISAGRTFKRGPTGEDVTFLRLFGLDEEAPVDALDPSFVYSPASEVFQNQPPVQGTFVVFPTLRPFAAPPPLPGIGLTAADAARVLGDDANEQIYEEEDPVERDNAGRFRLTLGYRLRSQGVISSFSLGAFGIRDGSEHVFMGDRLLRRGVDYEIDYDVGQVRLLEAEQLFAINPDASIRATWEQRSLFQLSPTQVFGLRTHTDLGSGGGIDILGLYQSERTVVTRPILGTEPGAALLGGVSGNYETRVRWLDRLLDGIPGVRLDGNTSLSLNGEFAISLPNPNTRGQTFVDDFDAASQLPVSLLSSEWQYGSAPEFRDGAEAVLPGALDASTAVPLVWQHSWIVESAVGDSAGVHEGFFPRRDIDHQIRVAGSEVREPGLLISFGRGLVDRPSWRSTTTSLSTNGLDLTRTEFLEFYASGADALTLVVDLGTVSEDAFFVDSLGNTTGTRAESGEPWGLGLLDQEADPRKGEIWSDVTDAAGVWGETCVGERGRIYRVGDPRSICTRGNGRQDTEDLDADGNLDTRERHLRYVVRLDGSSPFLARTKAETGTDFQLYRIPLRGVGSVEVGGAFSDADMRAVRHLRLTVAGGRNQRLELARMRLVGSRWIKRAGDGVLDGIVGDTLTGFGRVEVASVSRVTEGEAYSSPPGVLEELVDPTSAFSGQGIEFNEKSLGIRFDGVPTGARAEVYQRFSQRPRNFLAYRQARLWVVPREGDFGPDRPHYFFFKVGSDPENFYLFRTTLRPAASPAGVTPSDWLPEVVIDFETWFDLRRRAEERLLTRSRGLGDPPVTVWSADSTYAVVLRDRGRAPNLAAVREMSMGVWNEGVAPISGEVWVDELRLGRAVRDAGVATSFDMALEGAGVLRTQLSVTSRGAFFRQLRDDPSYQTDRTVALSSTLSLDRWLPAEWGVELPVTLDVNRSSQAPRFLANSDVRADRLSGLRSTDARQTRVGVSFRKSTPAQNPVLGFLIDGLDARMSYSASGGSSVTTRQEADGIDAGLGWARDPEVRDFGLVPDFAGAVVRSLLPGFLEDKVLGSRFRWSPERVSFGTSYSRLNSRIFRFERIVRGPDDTLAVVTLAPREAVQTAADIRFRPLTPLAANLAFLSVRDLLAPEDAVSDPEVQELIRSERSSLTGFDLGWETTRSLRTRVSFQPRVFSFLRSDFDWTTVYQSDRNANFLAFEEDDSGSPLALARNARGQRDLRANFSLDPKLLGVSWLGAPVSGENPEVTQLRDILDAVQPLTVTYQDGITSRFNRDPVEPGVGYQFGWGDRDAFLLMDGDTASTLTDRSAWVLGSGVTLPTGLTLAVAYQRTQANTLDTRSDRRTVQRRWPDLRARLPALRMPTVTGIRTLTLSSGIVRTRRDTEFGGRGAQRRLDEDTRIPLDVSVAWRGTLVTSYQGAFRTGNGSDPTGDTERRERNHRFTVSSQFVPPGSLKRRLDRPIRLTLLASYTSERDCRATAGADSCVPFLDQIRRGINLSLDTSVGGFEVGLQMSYDDRQSFVGQRTGSTQFQLGLFGQLQFSAGTLPIR
jgi:Motility related/secretion protein